MTPDSFEHRPNPSEVPTGRAWGRAARSNDRAGGLWVAAAAEEAGEIWLFLAGTRPPAAARDGPASRPPPPRSLPPGSRGGAGRDAGWRAQGAGAQAGGGRGGVPGPPPPPPTALILDLPLRSARTRGPGAVPRTCVPRRPPPAATPVGHGRGPGLPDPAR